MKVLHEDGREIELDEEWVADTHDEMRRDGHPDKNLHKMRIVKGKDGTRYQHAGEVVTVEDDGTKTVRWTYREE